MSWVSFAGGSQAGSKWPWACPQSVPSLHLFNKCPPSTEYVPWTILGARDTGTNKKDGRSDIMGFMF